MFVVYLKKSHIKILFILVVISIIGMATFGTFAQNKFDNSKVTDEKYRNFIIAVLNPYIYDALREYYGRPKNYDMYSIEILNINEVTYKDYYYEIEIKVPTYEGAHLSDFKNFYMKFLVDNSGIKLKNIEPI